MDALLNVYIFALRKKSAPLSLRDSKMYTPDTIANSQTDRQTQRTPTNINKNGAVATVRILVELGIL